ncbi:MAG: NAD(P)-dependent oxidoreductase [Saprospiraceae bacterium]
MGIYGFGKIGQQVAKIALAFGTEVIAHRKNMQQAPPPMVEYVSLEKLFSESDVLTTPPLRRENEGIVNAQHLSLMKPTSYIFNTGRGGLVNELDLKLHY